MSYAHSFLCAYLWWRDQSMRREHNDGWQDSKVCFTEIQPNSISLFCRSSFGWCTFSALIWLTPGAEAKLKHAPEKSPVWFWCKNIHRLRVLIKAFIVKKKGTKTVLSRVAKGVAKHRTAALRASDVCAENFSHSTRLLLQQSWACFMLALCLRAVLISSPDTWVWMRMHALAVKHGQTLCEYVDSAKIKVPF